jgi:phosphate transport system permease protein
MNASPGAWQGAALLRADAALRRRRRVNRAVEALATGAALLAVAILVTVFVSVMIKGASAINLDFFIHSEVPFGEHGGGIANAIVGTIVLIALASAFAVPVGILIGIYSHEYAHRRAAGAIRFVLDVLSGVPTIVTGIFVFGLLVVGGRQSGYAGAFALAIIMLPIVARSAQEILALVPKTVREGALALGVTRWKVLLRVVVPSAASGLVTGALLAVARVAGETAPLLFTSSIFPQGIVTNPSGALPSIPFRIFQLAEGNSPEEHAQAWAAALLLIMMVLALNMIARLVYARTRARIGGESR